MKLSKKSLLVITAGVFVIALAGLWMVYSQRVGEQKELNKALDEKQQRLEQVQNLEKLSSQQAELEKQLGQATSQFEAVEAILAQPTGSSALSGIVFDIAEAYGLEVTEMTSPGLASESLGKVPCSVISLTAKVEGDVSSLVSFITKLNSYLTTGVVKSITINIPEIDSGEKASADIQLVVYTYHGD